MNLTKNDKIEVIEARLMVNGRPFIVNYPSEPLSHVSLDGNLVTLQNNTTYNHWGVDQIEGYYA